jgi:hypothetical protein
VHDVVATMHVVVGVSVAPAIPSNSLGTVGFHCSDGEVAFDITWV